MVSIQRLMLWCDGFIWTRHHTWKPADTIMSPELWARDKDGYDNAIHGMDHKIELLPTELDKKKNLKIRLLTVTLTFDETKNVPDGLIDVPKGGKRI